MEGPGIESRWGVRFPRPSKLALVPPPASLLREGTVSFKGVKRPGRGVGHPTPSSAEVEERVELNFYSLSGPSWPVLG